MPKIEKRQRKGKDEVVSLETAIASLRVPWDPWKDASVEGLGTPAAAWGAQTGA